MQILVVSHFYPPLRDGGYAQLCAEVSDGLQARGHKIQVLTSNFGVNQQIMHEHTVYRLLHLENDLNYFSIRRFFINWYSDELANDRTISQIIQQVRPDIVFIWGMYGLSKNIPARFEKLMPGKVIYFISDLWPNNPSFVESYWSNPANSTRGQILKNLIKIGAKILLKLREYPPTLKLQHSMIVSKAVRSHLIANDFPLQNSVVIHSGINTSEYFFHRDEHWPEPGRTLQFLYAGNLGAHKGIHTAIQAFGILKSKFNQFEFRMVLAGEGHPAYEKELQILIQSLELSNQVTLVGKVDRREMPNLLRQFDVLLIPSECEDALPRIVQEAMMAGMVVIGSDRGGIPEMVIHGETGLIFKSGDLYDLAFQIHLIINDRSLVKSLAANGQKMAGKEFSIETMVDKIDHYLRQISMQDMC